MNKNYIILIIVCLSIVSILVYTNDTPTNDGSSLSYDQNKDIQLLLVESDIHMSSPLKLNGFSIERYCTFFSDSTIQRSIEYCTSTEILDSKGRFLGNVQMVGSTAEPKYVIAAIQTDEILSQSDELKKIIDKVIDVTVCVCWEDESPGDFASVSEWIDAAYAHHKEGTSTSKSTISNLVGKDLLLEVTSNQEGILWKLLITV